MNLVKAIQEIGCFQTGINIAQCLDSIEVINRVGEELPLPDSNIKKQIQDIAYWLNSFGKNNFMFLNPEMALIEEIAFLNTNSRFIIVLPSDLENSIKDRLSHNLPYGLNVELLNEPFFPDEFYPFNGLLIASGYISLNRLMVLPETYRLIDHYHDFKGKRLFIPYTKSNINFNRKWLQTKKDKFDIVWSEENEYTNSLKYKT